jgi:hypothetical protein
METRTELCKEREARQKAEAEVERLKEQLTHFDDVHCKCVPRLKAEVEKLKTEYWFMEATMTKEIATLKEAIK